MPGSWRSEPAMPPPPTVTSMKVTSTVVRNTCIHGLPAKMCGPCMGASPVANSYVEGPPHAANSADMVASRIQRQLESGASDGLPPSEVQRRAEKALRELAPQPARGYEQEQRQQFRPEISDSESESSSEPPQPPPQPKRYWVAPVPPPAPPRPPVYVPVSVPQPRAMKTPSERSLRDASVQVIQCEHAGVQTSEAPTPSPAPAVAPPPPTPPQVYSPVPTPSESVVVTPQQPPPPPPPQPSTPVAMVHPERSVFQSRSQPEPQHVPISLPPSPYVAQTPKKCGHAERVAKRRAEAERAEREAAAQRASAAVAAADEAERQTRLRAAKKAQEDQEALLQQASTERMLAEQAAVYAVSQREVAEAVLQQMQNRQSVQASDLSDVVGAVQQSANLAHVERVAAEKAAVNAAAKRAELESAVVQAEDARQHADRKMAEMQHSHRLALHGMAQVAGATEADRKRAEQAMHQAGNLVDAALKLLSSQQAPAPPAATPAPTPAPAAPASIHTRHVSPKRKKGTPAAQYRGAPPPAPAAPAPAAARAAPPPQQQSVQPPAQISQAPPAPPSARQQRSSAPPSNMNNEDDAASAASKAFTADLSEQSDGPQPVHEAVAHPSVTTSLPSLHPYENDTGRDRQALQYHAPTIETYDLPSHQGHSVLSGPSTSLPTMIDSQDVSCDALDPHCNIPIATREVTKPLLPKQPASAATGVSGHTGRSGRGSLLGATSPKNTPMPGLLSSDVIARLPPQMQQLVQQVQLALCSIPDGLPQEDGAPQVPRSEASAPASQQLQLQPQHPASVPQSLPRSAHGSAPGDAVVDAPSQASLNANDLLAVVSAVATLQDSGGNVPQHRTQEAGREESPPPANMCGDSPPISPSAVEMSRQAIANHQQQHQEQDEVENLLANALELVQAAEHEKKLATRKATALEIRANQLQARLDELGAEYAVGNLDAELLSELPSVDERVQKLSSVAPPQQALPITSAPQQPQLHAPPPVMRSEPKRPQRTPTPRTPTPVSHPAPMPPQPVMQHHVPALQPSLPRMPVQQVAPSPAPVAPATPTAGKERRNISPSRRPPTRPRQPSGPGMQALPSRQALQ